jgi:hypothetical protein
MIPTHRLTQAAEQGLDRHQAIASSSRLLRELEAYLARRRRRGYHTDFDDLFETLLPGLALSLHLLSEQEAMLETMNLQERWGHLHPATVKLLTELAATFGLEYADRIVAALTREVERGIARLREEKTELVIVIMEWGEQQGYPRFAGADFAIPEGIDGR